MLEKRAVDDIFSLFCDLDESAGLGKTSRMGTLVKIRRIGLEIERRREIAARNQDLKSNDLFALFLLQRAASQSLRAADLQKTMGLTSGGMSKNLDRLERRGLIKRVDDDMDRRAWRLQITGKGKEVAMAARHDPSWEIIEGLFNGLSEKEWQQVDQLIQKLSTAL